MRFVAGSNPASRTNYFNKGNSMSYHDNYHAALKNKGMAVVNPLHEQRKRLTQLEDLLREIAKETEDVQLQEKIGLILTGKGEK